MCLLVFLNYIHIDLFLVTLGNHLGQYVSLYKEMLKDYKFYLAFENSLCQDYITEKFFQAANAGVVPIVYGGISNLDYEEVKSIFFPH